ncbi:MAG: beta-phosphoglucomutase family hydrolase [Polyangiales bacterium]
MRDVHPRDVVTRARFDAVLFDLDGVLTSTAAIHADAWKRMFDAYLRAREGDAYVPFDIDRDYKRYVDGKPRYDGVRSFLASRGITLPDGTPNEPPGDATVCALGNRKDAMVQTAIDAGKVEAFDGSITWAQRLRDAGFQLAVVSSSRNCAQVLRAAGIDGLFSARVDGESLITMNLPGKPAPDSFLEAAKQLGVPPTRAVVVEDAISGVEAGRDGKFGLVIGVDREGEGHGTALRAHGADLVVRDLGELL